MSRERLPASSLERQRRDVENAREEIQVRKLFYSHLFRLRLIEGSCFICYSKKFLLYRDGYFFLLFKGFVDALDEEQRSRLLVAVLNNGRGSLDYARRLLENTEDNGAGDDPQPDPTNNGPRWCICHNCINMPTPDENKCCKRRECITSYELFSNLCIDRHVLELSIRARCDIRVEPLDFSMASFRKAAYRQFTLWEHGYLGKGNRRVLPSCAVTKIRAQYPSPDNDYMGFRAE